MQNSYVSFEQFLVVRGSGERALQRVTIDGYLGSMRRISRH